jgi:hypothetical protein
MDTYELHEYAEIFPAMSVAELEELEEDIKAKGLQHKITLYQGKILDGRHRYEMCMKLGLEGDFQEYNGDDPLGYVVTTNLCRRHLSDSQRAIIAARLMEKGWSSANLRSEKKSEQAAAALNVKPRTVESAANVLKSGIPKLVQAVSSGDVSVSAGEIVSKMPVEEQARIVANGKDAIVEAASQIRNARKSAAKMLHPGVETSRANEQQSTVDQDTSVGSCEGSDIKDSVTESQESYSEPREGNIDQLTLTEAQLVNFIRQASKTGSTWVIAGKGELPELQPDWLVHMVYAEDPSHVSAEKCDHGEEQSTDDVQNPAEVSSAGEPEIDTNHEPAALPPPEEKRQVDPILKETLEAAAKEFFRIKKRTHGIFRFAMKAATREACRCYRHVKGLDPSINDSVFTAKWRKMGWWPQTKTTAKETERFFRTIKDRLETGENLKYDPSKNLRSRKRPAGS